MEESVKNKVFSCNPVEYIRWKYSHRVKFLAKCKNPSCNIVAHTCNPEESKISKLSTSQGISCFEVAHTNECQGIFRKIQRERYHYIQTIPTHDVAKSLESLYAEQLPRRSF